MKRPVSTLFVIVALTLATTACHEDAGHTHGEGSHSHDPAETPVVSVTHWTERSELFMEYPAFLVGEPGKLLVHLTDLSDFSPVTEGRVVLEFAQGAERVVHDLLLARPEEDEIAVLRPGTLEHAGKRLVGEKLDDGRLQAVLAGFHVVDLYIGEALGAVDGDEVSVLVHDRSWQGAPAGHEQGGDPPPGVVGGL